MTDLADPASLVLVWAAVSALGLGAAACMLLAAWPGRRCRRRQAAMQPRPAS